MQQKFKYVSVDTILSKYLRDFKGLEFNEDELIEWIGEALGYMKMANASEEAIAFIEVRNYQAAIPNGLHYVIQIARNGSYDITQPDCCTPASIVKDLIHTETDCNKDCNIESLTVADCEGVLIGDKEAVYYRPYFDLQYEYLDWFHSKAYHAGFTPVRLANHSFFNTLVCQEPGAKNLYDDINDEYTIVSNEFRFSFKEGFIALAYLRQMVCPETGYPMIPDDESAKAAITYYIGWKIKEREGWNHREGAMQLAQLAEQKWLKYIKQFKNKAKMPWGTDEYENLMEQGNYLLPRNKRYYGFFGKLGTMENRIFNDPTQTNRYRYRYNSGNAQYNR